MALRGGAKGNTLVHPSGFEMQAYVQTKPWRRSLDRVVAIERALPVSGLSPVLHHLMRKVLT
jgi:hypothetical protein